MLGSLYLCVMASDDDDVNAPQIGLYTASDAELAKKAMAVAAYGEFEPMFARRFESDSTWSTMSAERQDRFKADQYEKWMQRIGKAMNRIEAQSVNGEPITLISVRTKIDLSGRI